MKPIGVREAASASLMKRVSQFWTHRFPIKSVVCSLFFSFKVKYQLHEQFRDGGFHVFPLKLLLVGMSFHFHEQENSLFSPNKQTFPIRYFSSSKFQQNLLEQSFPQEASNWMSVQISFKRNHGIFDVCPMRFGHLSRGRRIQKSGHSDSGIFTSCGASSIWYLWYLCVNRCRMGCLSCTIK